MFETSFQNPTIFEVAGFLLVVKYLFILVSLGFVAFAIFVLFKTRWFRLLFWYDFVEFLTQKIYGGVLAGWRWRLVRAQAERAQSKDYCSFALKGHKIMDRLLERLVPTYQVNSYGERLARCAAGTFTKAEDLWWAHELYRAVTAGSVKRINDDDFKKLINAYEQAFKDLGVG